MNQTFDIVPPPNSALIFFGVLILFLTSLLLLFSWMAYKSFRTSIRIENDQLIFDTAIYGRKLPLSELKRSEVEIVDIEKGSPLEPQVRTNGLGLPGLQTGWFGLRNGGKALLALTSRKRVVHIPTSQRYSIIVSVQNPEALVEIIRSN